MQVLHTKYHGDIKLTKIWANSNGKRIALLADGSYTYTNGQPITKRGDFQEVLSGADLKKALAWFDKREADEKEQKIQESIKADLVSGEPVILYSRRKDGEEASEPSYWQRFFDEKPSWWGTRQKVQDKETGWTYVKEGAVPNSKQEK